MHLDAGAAQRLADGLAAIREEFQLPAGFPAEVLADATDAARRGPRGADRVDLTGLDFRTLDPADSTDLDQAFALEQAGDDVVIHYAIADVSAFVDDGSPLDREAWERGCTIYLPGGKVPVYPAALSEAAASLLPDGPRPAVVLRVAVDPEGEARLDGVQRAMVRSRAKLAYESVGAADLPPGLAELARRMDAAEDRRGATRVDLPEQEVVDDPSRPGGLALALRPRLVSEDLNATMSLAANLAVAAAMHRAGTGLFRVQPDPDRRERRELREQAKALGIDWPESMSLRQLLARLDPANPQHAHLVLSVRRASGGASYEPFAAGRTPWHSAMAATYAHATAPLRRLADRYVLRAALALGAGDPVPDEVLAAFAALPDTMRRCESRAAQVERAAIDFVEAVELHGHEGEEFDAVVVDPGDGRAKVQLLAPAVVALVETRGGLAPGQPIRLRLVEADPAKRRVRFSVVAGQAPTSR